MAKDDATQQQGIKAMGDNMLHMMEQMLKGQGIPSAQCSRLATAPTARPQASALAWLTWRG